ncbi:transcription antitermination factor NusB [Bacillus sp. FJAT-42376]|uniref:transcription antitermination factor NusB n=1 Tax=Bacillus sp. FJAT-42376 TaxID=2014076 RepID=UPI000F50FA05|nr:transcription antitermination factor NusB [Bacillus sp. FJAT-42376]AZB43530.1 transcription antitermination factor NusB [Bacillus sp. FJAT-42376]
MNRRAAREKALQALFQIDVSQIDPADALQHAFDEDEINSFTRELVTGTISHIEEIDALIKPHLVNWKLDRLANVDRGILRLAAYEMKYEDGIPASVSIDEAIELAKAFGDDQSSRFVNGVLSNIRKDIETI